MLWSFLAQYGGGGGGNGGGGGGFSATYWIVVAIIAAVVITGIAWLLARRRSRLRTTRTSNERGSGRTDRAA